MKNGRDVGKEHLATIEAYIASGAAVPLGRDGSLNLTELGKLTGVPKSSFYQNPAVRTLVEGLRTSNGASPEPGATERDSRPEGSARNLEDKKSQRLEKRVQVLEQQNAALVAENCELRRQLKDVRLQLGREDMTIETGRRVPRPEAS